MLASVQYDGGRDDRESGGVTGAAAAATTAGRTQASTGVIAPANTGSMFRYQKFKECPAKRPLTVCIDIPGVNVTHREVGGHSQFHVICPFIRVFFQHFPGRREKTILCTLYMTSRLSDERCR